MRRWMPWQGTGWQPVLCLIVVLIAGACPGTQQPHDTYPDEPVGSYTVEIEDIEDLPEPEASSDSELGVPSRSTGATSREAMPEAESALPAPPETTANPARLTDPPVLEAARKHNDADRSRPRPNPSTRKEIRVAGAKQRTNMGKRISGQASPTAGSSPDPLLPLPRATSPDEVLYVRVVVTQPYIDDVATRVAYNGVNKVFLIDWQADGKSGQLSVRESAVTEQPIIADVWDGTNAGVAVPSRYTPIMTPRLLPYLVAVREKWAQEFNEGLYASTGIAAVVAVLTLRPMTAPVAPQSIGIAAHTRAQLAPGSRPAVGTDGARMTAGQAATSSAGVSTARGAIPSRIPVSEGLERVASVRRSSSISARRNIALADVYIIDGQKRTLIGVSGQNSPAGTVATPENPVFQTIRTGNNPRMLDSEVKILETLAGEIDSGTKGVINLFTERAACISCGSVIMQFRQRFPGIKLNVTAGE